VEVVERQQNKKNKKKKSKGLSAFMDEGDEDKEAFANYRQE
jgi:hypothetical protein